MEAFDVLDGIAAPLDFAEVDTGTLMPARFLRKPRREGFSDYLFHDLRYCADGTENPNFVLNRAVFRNARILVAGGDFGSGSSREQAVWGLADFGIRCVIAKSFGDIFQDNAFKAGILPVRLPQSECDRLRALLHAHPGTRLRVDLANQVVGEPGGDVHEFSMDAFRKRCLMQGLDDIGLTLGYIEDLQAFEASYRARHDWLYPDREDIEGDCPREDG